ncbi:hypothetical protein G9A89_000892 [Geosiphon pyriformis]|nr:hypothetical protein G9A89_000892 [Geosiphon pyriformis]
MLGACIMITGKGYPDLATRQLVKLIADQIKRNPPNWKKIDHGYAGQTSIPILGLFDNDPYGIDIFSVYRCGSTVSADLHLNMALRLVNLILNSLVNVIR